QIVHEEDTHPKTYGCLSEEPLKGWIKTYSLPLYLCLPISLWMTSNPSLTLSNLQRGVHRTTKPSPFEVVYGFNPLTPLELIPLPLDTSFIHKEGESRKDRFPTKRKSKLSPRGDGPFQVLERVNKNAYRLDLPDEYGINTTFNISYLIPFAGGADIEEEELTDLRSNPLQGEGNDAILPRKGPVTRAMSKRLQQDWVRTAEEGLRILMNLKVGTYSYLCPIKFGIIHKVGAEHPSTSQPDQEENIIFFTMSMTYLKKFSFLIFVLLFILHVHLSTAQVNLNAGVGTSNDNGVVVVELGDDTDTSQEAVVSVEVNVDNDNGTSNEAGVEADVTITVNVEPDTEVPDEAPVEVTINVDADSDTDADPDTDVPDEAPVEVTINVDVDPDTDVPDEASIEVTINVAGNDTDTNLGAVSINGSEPETAVNIHGGGSLP
ncbi:hypothetical protein D0Y65_018078, partial [Glycine soja]